MVDSDGKRCYWALGTRPRTQRPWKAFQRMGRLAIGGISEQPVSEITIGKKDVEKNPDYARLKLAKKRLINSKAQACRSPQGRGRSHAHGCGGAERFTDRRAYVNAIQL